MFENIVYIVAGVLGGLFIGLVVLKNKKFVNLEKDVETARELIAKSQEEARVLKDDTKSFVEKRMKTIEQEDIERNERLNKIAEALKNKEESLKKREDRNNEIKLKLVTYKEETEALEGAIKRADKSLLEKLAQKTGSSLEEAKDKILSSYKEELENENAEKLARLEEWYKENAEKRARMIVINVLQRLCSTSSVETRAVHVEVPRDQVKGKIVGRDGQNIKEFERLLDVDVVFNDLPNTISISAFQLVKRRIAHRAMEKLTRVKGDIDKSIVQKLIKDAERETDDELYEIGKKALIKMGIKHDDKEFCRITGRLQYRTSYGQNIMKHSMEVGWVAAMLGAELGLNITTCKVGGFLHDLGKAIDQDPNVKDAHDYLSKELMEKFGFSWEEVHAAWTHHDAIPQETPEALIVKAADAVSAGRPGARQESFEKYIERIYELEEAATSFEGVKNAYAISAGRELRVIVLPDMVDDAKMKVLAKNMAEKIENEITYPGQIKVNIIRRTKYTELAN